MLENDDQYNMLIYFEHVNIAYENWYFLSLTYSFSLPFHFRTLNNFMENIIRYITIVLQVLSIAEVFCCNLLFSFCYRALSCLCYQPVCIHCSLSGVTMFPF